MCGFIIEQVRKLTFPDLLDLLIIQVNNVNMFCFNIIMCLFLRVNLMKKI